MPSSKMGMASSQSGVTQTKAAGTVSSVTGDVSFGALLHQVSLRFGAPRLTDPD